jgi:hypothetical protein
MEKAVDFITEDLVLAMEAKVFFAQPFILSGQTPQVKHSSFAQDGKEGNPQQERNEGQAQPGARFLQGGHGWRQLKYSTFHVLHALSSTITTGGQR